MKAKQVDEKKCCICSLVVEPWPTRDGHPPGGYGHNPEPVKKYDEGRACNWCNQNVVVPVRIRQTFHWREQQKHMPKPLA